jgi:DnaK suppressor protein
MEHEKERYNKTELAEFRQIIMDKLAIARREFEILRNALKQESERGGDGNRSLNFEDGAETFEKENMNLLAGRQLKFINSLEGALVRIENGTYGVCRTTGKLIPAARLRAVPHTTQTIEAKLSEK